MEEEKVSQVSVCLGAHSLGYFKSAVLAYCEVCELTQGPMQGTFGLHLWEAVSVHGM